MLCNEGIRTNTCNKKSPRGGMEQAIVAGGQIERTRITTETDKNERKNM